MQLYADVISSAEKVRQRGLAERLSDARRYAGHLL
jgi:hypothetical protein